MLSTVPRSAVGGRSQEAAVGRELFGGTEMGRFAILMIQNARAHRPDASSRTRQVAVISEETLILNA